MLFEILHPMHSSVRKYRYFEDLKRNRTPINRLYAIDASNMRSRPARRPKTGR